MKNHLKKKVITLDNSTVKKSCRYNFLEGEVFAKVPNYVYKNCYVSNKQNYFILFYKDKYHLYSLYYSQYGDSANKNYLSRRIRGVTYYLHRMRAFAFNRNLFKGLKAKELQVHHIDKNSLNNELENLFIVPNRYHKIEDNFYNIGYRVINNNSDNKGNFHNVKSFAEAAERTGQDLVSIYEGMRNNIFIKNGKYNVYAISNTLTIRAMSYTQTKKKKKYKEAV
ncbi:MAG: HNH endonuclease [Clostridiales bacterium]|nr:HNH endonuclease [Clostridiales bacterium]